MYPTVVIVLVETQRSMSDICEVNLLNASRLAGPVASEARTEPLGHPSFAVLDNEADSPPSRAWRSGDVRGHGLENIIFELNLKESG